MSNHSNYPAGVTDRMVFDLYLDPGPEFCAICGAADPKHLTNIGSTRHPEEWCDTCLVENATNCGDWTESDIAAAIRMNAEHPDQPTA